MAKIWNTDNTKCWRECGGNRNSHSLLVGRQNGTATLEDSLVVSYKTKHPLTIQPSNHAPWYLPKGVEKLCPHKTLHRDIYISFIHNCQNLEQPECHSVGEYPFTNTRWYIQTMEYYSLLKRNELSSHEKIRRKLKCILQSERSQTEKATYCMIPTIWHSGKDKTMETIKRSVVARGGRWERD